MEELIRQYAAEVERIEKHIKKLKLQLHKEKNCNLANELRRRIEVLEEESLKQIPDLTYSLAKKNAYQKDCHKAVEKNIIKHTK